MTRAEYKIRAAELNDRLAVYVDVCNRRLVALAERQEKLDRRRRRYSDDQLMQLEMDRAQADIDKLRKTYRKLKEESSSLEV